VQKELWREHTGLCCTPSKCVHLEPFPGERLAGAKIAAEQRRLCEYGSEENDNHTVARRGFDRRLRRSTNACKVRRYGSRYAALWL
jgi:hypothetical protein